MTQEDFFTGSHGQKLFYRVDSPAKPKASLIVLHGLAEHSGRYDLVAKFFAGSGFAVYRYDQRGHGKSSGKRAYIDSFQEFSDDLKEFAEFVEQKSKRTPYLLAHSFGAQVAINFLAQHPKWLPGAVLSSPNVRLGFSLPWLKQMLGRNLSKIIPAFRVKNDVDPNFISHDPKVVAAYKQDPLVERSITLRLGDEILKNLSIIMDLAPKIKTSCLVFHGDEDRITSCPGTQDFFKRMKSKDRQLKIYPGFYHECMNERGQEQVHQDILQWLQGRIAQ